MRATAFLFVLSTTLACGGPRGSESSASSTAAEGSAEDRASGGVAAEGTPVRVFYDLAANLERAEVREGTTLLVDFGSPGASKYTLGGFQTGVVLDEHEGRSRLLVLGTSGRIALPIVRTGEATEDLEVVLKAKAVGGGEIRLHLCRASVGRACVDGRALEVNQTPADDGESIVLRASLPDDLEGGEHELLLRAGRMARVQGVGRVSAAVDWLRVGTSAASLASDPPTPTAAEEGGLATLSIPKGASLGFTFRVPPEARVRGLVRTEGSLTITAHRDGRPPRELGVVERDGALDADLSGLEGEVVRVDLAARGRPVRLLHPAVVVPGAAAEVARPAAPKNVLLYLIDTLRADKLEPYAPDTRVQTPGLARFLRGATVVDQARSQENWTKPSVATLLSSLFPWQHTATGGESIVPSSVKLLPEMLREHGFFTGSLIANGYVSDRFGFRQGWNTYRNYIREGRRTKAEFVAADALRFLDERPQDKPFLLYVHTIDPHVPYRPPDDFLRLYGDPSYRGRVSFRRDALMLEHIKSGRVPLAPRDRAHLEALYDGEISYHDVHFAAILDGLERRGLADETLVIVTSDHGEEFWDHGSVGHGHSVFDELLRVPLFVRHPGVGERLERITTPVGLVDVVPTVLEALGLPADEDLAGRSFLPALLGAHPLAPETTVSGFMEAHRTLVVDGLKLHQRARARHALYDLMEDPGETDDQASSRPIALRYARGLLGLTLAESRGRGSSASPTRPARRTPPRHRAQSREIDPETAAQLRALGYIH